MDIVVKGRNVEVPDHFRQHVSDKLSSCERLDAKVFRVDVELHHERNPRQSAQCQRVEITARGKGPVIRAEATAADFYAAMDVAALKLEARLRRSHDRRRVHHGLRTPPSVAEATAALPQELPPLVGSRASTAVMAREDVAVLSPGSTAQPVDDTDFLIVRDKTHRAQPMTSAQALHEMELVGHDFFLFIDSESGLPSVVYCRHGYDYGVIRVQSGP